MTNFEYLEQEQQEQEQEQKNSTFDKVDLLFKAVIALTFMLLIGAMCFVLLCSCTGANAENLSLKDRCKKSYPKGRVEQDSTIYPTFNPYCMVGTGHELWQFGLDSNNEFSYRFISVDEQGKSTKNLVHIVPEDNSVAVALNEALEQFSDVIFEECHGKNQEDTWMGSTIEEMWLDYFSDNFLIKKCTVYGMEIWYISMKL